MIAKSPHHSTARAAMTRPDLKGNDNYHKAEAAVSNQSQSNSGQQTTAAVNNRLTRPEKLVDDLTPQFSKVTERIDQMLTILVNLTSQKA